MSVPANPESAARQPFEPFATTQWSMVVRAAGDDDSRIAQVALADLCQQYWYPLYCFVRSKVSSQEDAADVVQGFFLQLLEKESLRMADQERGRFRNFLLASVSNYLKNHRRDANAIKRGGDVKHLSIDFEKANERFQLEPIDKLTPERIFERSWAMELIQRCLGDLRNQYEAKGKHELFDSLCGSLLGGEASYADIASQFSLSTNAVKVAAHRMRQGLGERIRAEVANTVETPEEIEVELKHLMSVFHG